MLWTSEANKIMTAIVWKKLEYQVQAYIATYSSQITGVHISRVDNHEHGFKFCYISGW